MTTDARQRFDSTVPELGPVSPELSALLVARSLRPLPPAGASAQTARMAILSAVAGYADAAGFVTLAGLFPAHVTGEIVGVLSGASGGALHHEHGRISAVFVFIGAVICGALVSRAQRQRGKSPLSLLLALMAASLAVFALSDLLWLVDGHAHPITKTCAIVTAMALQNVVMRGVLTSSCPTTVMTGNLTQFVIELCELLFGRLLAPATDRSAIRARSSKRLRVVGLALGAFFVGAVCGGFSTTLQGSVGACVPAAVLAVLAWKERRHPMALSRTGTLF